MKIAFITDQAPDNIQHWSGIPYYLSQGLQRQGHEICPLNLKAALPEGCRRSVLATPYVPADSLWHTISPVALKWVARQLEAELQSLAPDLVMSHGAFGLAYLESPLPLVYWEDMPSLLLTQTYARYAGADSHLLSTWEQLEQLAFLNASYICFPSDWAADCARSHYGVDPQRLRVIPFGANLSPDPTAAELEQSLAQRSTQTCQLLFVGKDWQRKGGPQVLELTQRLNQAGLPCRLVIVGCEPEIPSLYQPWVQQLGFLDKSQPADRQKLAELFQSSHFFVMPSEAEGFGIVYCEASAYGVPSLARNVGGVASAVRHGYNGFVFAPEAGLAPFLEVIKRYFADREAYAALARSSFGEYQQRLNWEVASASFSQLLHSLL